MAGYRGPRPSPGQASPGMTAVSAFLNRTPWRRRLSPGEDGLLQVVDTGGAAGKHLPELIDQRRRRRVDSAAIDVQADDVPVALGNGDEFGYVRPHDVGDGNVVHGCHLVRIEAQPRVGSGPNDDWRDEVARARRVVVEEPQDVACAEEKRDFLAELAQC